MVFIINMHSCLQSPYPFLVWFLITYHILSDYWLSQTQFHSQHVLFCHLVAVSTCLSHNFCPSAWLSTSPLQDDCSFRVVSNLHWVLHCLVSFFFVLFMVHCSSICNCPEIYNLTSFLQFSSCLQFRSVVLIDHSFHVKWNPSFCHGTFPTMSLYLLYFYCDGKQLSIEHRLLRRMIPHGKASWAFSLIEVLLLSPCRLIEVCLSKRHWISRLDTRLWTRDFD